VSTESPVRVDSSADVANETDSSAAYRPHLDGLRAVAVYLVVLFHAGSHPFSGGFVGVDVFFVLSGFLVTQLLLRDIVRSGSIGFARFYARRFRRLLPAAFVALTVSAVVFAAIASPSEVADSVGSFKAAFLYSTNWYFIHQATGYFGADLSTNPVLHFWSLAVEEQFYLVWPLLLGGLFAVTRRWDRERQLRVIRIVVAVAAIASAVWALSLRNANPNRAYYGTDARAYELLAGALLALVPTLVASLARFRRAMGVAALSSGAVLLVLASSWVDVNAIIRAVAVTIVTCALIAALEVASGGVLKRALSHNSIVYLGKVSYGTYLWHWLIIVVLARSFHVSSIAAIGITALLATALASLSYEMLERPVRGSPLLDRYRRVVIASGLAISALSALVLIPVIVDPANASVPVVQGSTSAGFTPVPATPDWRTATKGEGRYVTCLNKPVSDCTVVRGTGRSILLMGDSHAWMMIPAFTEIARRDNLTLSVSVRGGCPWQRNLYVFPITANGATLRLEDCKKMKDDTYTRVIPELRPDLIVVMTVAHEKAGLVPFLGPSGRVMTEKSPQFASWIQTTTTRSLAALRADGRKVVIIEPIPTAPFNPLACLSKAKVLEECRYVADAAPDVVERLYRQDAKDGNNVWSADFDRLVCPFLPICDPEVNGQIVKQDGTHLTAKFSQTMAPQIETYLKGIGAIPR
jgi:peptidoglycan/LPS O-acetylase OafA/YrhL